MNNEETLTGSCLCGECKYAITSELKHFFHCHCIQCQKMTASAFAANIIAVPTKINWLSGEENIKRFDYPERDFTQVFCMNCGSGLPFLDGRGELLFIPTGTLDNVPKIKPEANIYWTERAKWYEHGITAPRQDACDNM
ncbi:GFA family protein [Colwellia sp. E2M01]|uniref:GFA family protein n=1 Tax=Colwellia sp. E2M01 TaxID=2841561 RepID=UPI001C093850|nr:GFA family protein [Colwellia sp. E2M01]MBU2869771.1 GFA family protein [Colwellia sp. E2M01]